VNTRALRTIVHRALGQIAPLEDHIPESIRQRFKLTILLIEHETEAAQRADRLLLMDGGRLVADGPPEQLLRDVWGYVSMGNTRTLDAHACRLRKKLAGSARPFVLNLRGVGYRLTEAL